MPVWASADYNQRMQWHLPTALPCSYYYHRRGGHFVTRATLCLVWLADDFMPCQEQGNLKLCILSEQTY